MKHCLMITGGPLDLSFAKEFIKGRSYDMVIAVDAGFSSCQQLGVHPDLLVGDFDTFGRDKIKQYLERSEYTIDMHQPEKDETDTELAFRHARLHNCTTVDVLGALGGRIDHELSNLHLLVHEKKKGLAVNYYDQKNKIFGIDAEIDGGFVFKQDFCYGKYVSFLPITEQVKGITLTGFKYPLTKKDISILQNPSLCVSNEVVEPEAKISFDEGILICIESRD